MASQLIVSKLTRMFFKDVKTPSALPHDITDRPLHRDNETNRSSGLA